MAADPFSGMVAQLRTMTSPMRAARSRPPEHDLDHRTDELIAHFRNFDCMPFPAGPVLPRLRTDQLPMFATTLTANVRAAAALLALCELEGTIEGDDSRVKRNASSYTGQVRYAIEEWVSRHDAQQPQFRPLLLSLDHMFSECAEELRLTNNSEGRVGVHVNSLIDRIDVNYSNDSPIAARIRRAFAAPRYRCACAMGAGGPNDIEEVPGELGTACKVMVKTVLDSPLGEWKLLGLLFFKLLHGHLAYPHRRGGRRAAAHDVLYPLVRRLVDAVARDALSQLAPFAAGIALAIRDASPWVIEADEGAGVTPASLPDCFDPGTFDPEAATLAQARLALNDEACGGCFDFGGWVDQTASLAREVASALTDPQLALLLQLSADDCMVLAKHYGSWKSLKKDVQERLARMAPRFERWELIPSLERLFRHHGWMAYHGLDALDKAFAALRKGGITPPDPIAGGSAAVHGGPGGRAE